MVRAAMRKTFQPSDPLPEDLAASVVAALKPQGEARFAMPTNAARMMANADAASRLETLQAPTNPTPDATAGKPAQTVRSHSRLLRI